MVIELIGGNQSMKVGRRRLVELRLSGHAEHRNVRLSEDGDDTRGFVGRAPDHGHEVRVARHHLLGSGDSISRFAASVKLLTAHHMPHYTAGAVDGSCSRQARGEVRRSESGVGAGERRDDADEQGRLAGRSAGGRAPARGEREGEHREEDPNPTADPLMACEHQMPPSAQSAAGEDCRQ